MVEIVVPVHNEEEILEQSVRRLHAFVNSEFPHSWRITIADNASADGTPGIARRLAAELSGVASVRLERKGRGRALRQVWAGSEAEFLAYMDVDLSTGLESLLPLVAPLIAGECDLAVGTRLASGARVVRSRKRELISRGYNHFLHLALGTGFSDAQCGFKAGRGEAIRALLPEVEDESWFFDTELLVLAERRGLRIHEVPVNWVENHDSRVDLRQSIAEDLRGTWRLRRA